MKIKDYGGFTLAQQLLIAMGVPAQTVLFQHHKDKSASHTKKGPGRKAQNGLVGYTVFNKV